MSPDLDVPDLDDLVKKSEFFVSTITNLDESHPKLDDGTELNYIIRTGLTFVVHFTSAQVKEIREKDEGIRFYSRYRCR